MLVYVGYVLVPVAWLWIARTRPGLHLRAVGEAPGRGRRAGHRRLSTRYAYVFIGGHAGRAGRRDHHARHHPGWFGDQTVNGRGWIAVGLVIFAQWSPLRAAFGASCSARSSGSSSTSRESTRSSASTNPFTAGRSATFFLEMLPYLMVILVVVIGSREAVRKRVGAPAALGRPYVRGERGA